MAGKILGLDLGSNSIGWALLDANPSGGDDCASAIVSAGVRIFEAGTDGNRDAGREESRNAKRRQMRLQRRLIRRRAQRFRKIFRTLQGYGLLPAGNAALPEVRQDLLATLDSDILSSSWFREYCRERRFPQPAHVLPYVLRAAALDVPLDPFLFGRALYHLAQRRGYQSNSRQISTEKAAEDLGVVEDGIRALSKQMADAQARTLAKYFVTLDPHVVRIRQRWTSRSMYRDEFERIWNTQARFRPEIYTDEKRKSLSREIFYQRPIKFPRQLVGSCELESGQRRAPRHLLLSQRFRLLQSLNNLAIIPPNELPRPLTSSERALALHALETEGDCTFANLRKILGLPRNSRFNLEDGGEKILKGARTSAALFAVFGEAWSSFSPDLRDAVVEYLWSFQNPGKLASAAQKKWGLDASRAEKFAAISLEPDYASLSVKAMQKLLPSLEAGVTFGEARRTLYPDQSAPRAPLEKLPPVTDVFPSLRNPGVIRCLTEMRKLVNALIDAHGKPAEFRIELGRELRNSKRQRQDMAERMRNNERQKQQARRKIEAEMPSGYRVSNSDILKIRLAEECRWECPYTGQPISMKHLVGPESQFDIEHIVPFARSLDNSFANLTLCHSDHNRHVKQRQTPREAYGAQPELFDAILSRVRRFTSGLAREKLRRFLLTSEEVSRELEEFSSRQLNDTRYASKIAGDYLALLYGGRVDRDGKLRIRVSSGRVTAFLRDEWKLNTVLNDGQTTDGGAIPKSRDDHRHHAIDALVVALTGDGTIAMLSRAAERAPLERRRRFASIQEPWPGFVDSARKLIAGMVVSHRFKNKLRGELHQESLYSSPIQMPSPPLDPAAKPARKTVRSIEHRIRKPVSKLTLKEVLKIADPAVREAVQTWIRKNGEAPPKDIFSDTCFPFLTARDGRTIPIKKVRIGIPERPHSIAQGKRARHVLSESNHHTEIFAELDKEGRELLWDAQTVSRADAIARKRASEPIVKRDWGPGCRFKFSLAAGDAVELDGPDGRPQRMVVRALSLEPRIALVALTDARKKTEMKDDYIRLFPNALRKKNARKLRVTVLGQILEAND